MPKGGGDERVGRNRCARQGVPRGGVRRGSWFFQRQLLFGRQVVGGPAVQPVWAELDKKMGVRNCLESVEPYCEKYYSVAQHGPDAHEAHGEQYAAQYAEEHRRFGMHDVGMGPQADQMTDGGAW